MLLATPQRQTRSESVSTAYRKQCRTQLTDFTRRRGAYRVLQVGLRDGRLWRVIGRLPTQACNSRRRNSDTAAFLFTTTHTRHGQLRQQNSSTARHQYRQPVNLCVSPLFVPLLYRLPVMLDPGRPLQPRESAISTLSTRRFDVRAH